MIKLFRHRHLASIFSSLVIPMENHAPSSPFSIGSSLSIVSFRQGSIWELKFREIQKMKKTSCINLYNRNKIQFLPHNSQNYNVIASMVDKQGKTILCPS